MKWITRDTVNALMSSDPKAALLKCGFTATDIADGESLYNALHTVKQPEDPVISIAAAAIEAAVKPMSDVLIRHCNIMDRMAQLLVRIEKGVCGEDKQNMPCPGGFAIDTYDFKMALLKLNWLGASRISDRRFQAEGSVEKDGVNVIFKSREFFVPEDRDAPLCDDDLWEAFAIGVLAAKDVIGERMLHDVLSKKSEKGSS